MYKKFEQIVAMAAALSYTTSAMSLNNAVAEHLEAGQQLKLICEVDAPNPNKQPITLDASKVSLADHGCGSSPSGHGTEQLLTSGEEWQHGNGGCGGMSHANINFTFTNAMTFNGVSFVSSDKTGSEP